jgi:hypothetical protein
MIKGRRIRIKHMRERERTVETLVEMRKHRCEFRGSNTRVASV